MFNILFIKVYINYSLFFIGPISSLQGFFHFNFLINYLNNDELILINNILNFINFSSDKMADFEEIINTRRRIREYDSKEDEDEKIEMILKAGMQAPGSRLGAEPWEFLIIKNKETLAKIGEIKPRVTNAPVAILLIANIERSFYKLVWQQDMSAAAENMLLEAVNLGLGGLWNGVAPEEERMNAIGEIVGLPKDDNLKPFCIITLGYPAEGWENKFMDKYDESRIHYETY